MPPLQRILYVDDEVGLQAVARLALEKIGGFSVRTCLSGEEALRVAQAFAPDLFLLDVMMPGLDGPATLAALRQLPGLADTPAIFMTAKSEPEEIARLKAAGALGVIAKPFDPLTVASEIRAVWESRDG